jgi:hypothetical protein
MELKLFHYNYYTAQKTSFEERWEKTASVHKFSAIRRVSLYPRLPLRLVSLLRPYRSSRKTIFMNFTCEIGFHAFLSFPFRSERRKFPSFRHTIRVRLQPANIKFSFISFPSARSSRARKFLLKSERSFFASRFHVKTQQ